MSGPLEYMVQKALFQEVEVRKLTPRRRSSRQQDRRTCFKAVGVGTIARGQQTMTPNRKRRISCIAVLVLLSPIIGLALRSATATKPQNLGVVDGRLAPCPHAPNCVSTQATKDSHRMEPLPFEGGMDESRRRLEAALATLPRLKIITATADYLHAEATSRIF